MNKLSLPLMLIREVEKNPFGIAICLFCKREIILVTDLLKKEAEDHLLGYHQFTRTQLSELEADWRVLEEKIHEHLNPQTA